MLRPNSISPSTFHSTVENMSGIAEAVHFPLSTRLIKAWKGGKETAGQKEEGTKAVSHHTPDADNKLERQRPMAGRGGCMLISKTYTPAIEAEAAPILPGVAAHLRAQVARQWARLLEMARSSENPRPAGPAKSHYHRDNERKLLEVRSAESLRPAGNVSEFIAIRKTLPHSAHLGGGDIETIIGPLSEGKPDSPEHKTGPKSAAPLRLTKVPPVKSS